MISIVINLDSRPGFMEQKTSAELMFHGTRSLDYFTYGVRNKINFFHPEPVETTVFVDHHSPLPEDAAKELQSYIDTGLIDNLIYSKHREYFKGQPYFSGWNDLNYLHALFCSRGEYIVHFDGDMAAFRRTGNDVINKFKGLLDSGQYKFISYPTPLSPNPDSNPHGDWDYFWASTRFFMCKREALDFTEILKCLENPDYMYGKYGDKKRRCPWLEHILGIITGPGQVFYPPIEGYDYMIFSWCKYETGLYAKLMNTMHYDQQRHYVQQLGGIYYPCDVKGALI